MKALIMNAGIGRRMGELTKDRPKCLIEISKGETILGNLIKGKTNNQRTDGG